MDELAATLDVLWRFVRGDMAPRAFEQWVYAQNALEAQLGERLYFETIDADYADPSEVCRLRSALAQFARSAAPPRCECVALPNTAVVDMANPEHALDHFQEIARRGEPYWWLWMARCSACNTAWLVAQEERQNDIFLLRRLTEDETSGILDRSDWPRDFDRYETLLQLGGDAGHRVVFVDPIADSSLRSTMRDLARERPGIRVSELAQLLNLDAETAVAVARDVVDTQGVDIDMDVDPLD